MALASVTHTVPSPVTQDYTIPFEFLREGHIVVKVDGSTSGVTFTIDSSWDELTINTPILLAGQTVTIERVTPVTDASELVSFNDASTLRRSDLETFRKQTLYRIQELDDELTSGLPLDMADSKWDAQSRIIKNVANPGSTQDAATKGYVDTALISSGALPDPSTGNPFDVLRIDATGTAYELATAGSERHLLRIKSQSSGPVGFANGWQLPSFASGFTDASQRAPLEFVSSLDSSGLVSLAGNTFDLTLGVGKWVIDASGHLRGLTDTSSTNASSGQIAITDSSGGILSAGTTSVTGVSVVTGSDVAPVTISKPSAFPWTPPILPKRIRRGYRGTVSARSLRNTTGSTLYVDVVTGDDGVGTGSIGAPFKSIWKAVTSAGVKTVRVAPGIYGFANRWGNAAYAADLTTLNVEKWPLRAGEVYATTALTITSWAAVGTAWEETGLDFISHVVDLSVRTQDGAPTRYAEVASVAACQATPGSFHRTGTGAGQTVTVHPLDSGEPGHDILVLRQDSGATVSTNVTLNLMPDVYVDGITFIGGSGGFGADNTAGSVVDGTIVMVNCRFYSAMYNGFFSKAIDVVILENCEAHNNEQDGFHHTNSGSRGTKAIEINCTYNGNGTTAISDTSNGSTIHDYCAVVRIGCHAERNVGSNYADTGTPATPATMSYSWMVGCSSGSTSTHSLTLYMTGFHLLNQNTMFLYECDSAACLQDLNVSAGCVCYTDSCHFGTTNNAGTLTPTTLFADSSVVKTAQMSTLCRVLYLVDVLTPTVINLRGRASTSSHSVVADFPSYLTVTRVG